MLYLLFFFILCIFGVQCHGLISSANDLLFYFDNYGRLCSWKFEFLGVDDKLLTNFPYFFSFLRITSFFRKLILKEAEILFQLQYAPDLVKKWITLKVHVIQCSSPCSIMIETSP